MLRTPDKDAFIAASRFGLSPRPGELARAAGDPRGWLRAQLRGDGTEAPDARPALEALADLLRARRAKDAERLKAARKALREQYIERAAARTLRQIETDMPFRERLVAFWSNHFTVSIRKPPLLALAAPFENQAIRPHVTGRFADMLKAVVGHPAMLVYLDNAQSIGPNSFAGQRRGRGLNENLAREVLELHTLGVDGGYTQADVRAFAKMLTGWSIQRPGRPGGGQFRYRPRIHEPGRKTLLGVVYEERGEDEVVAALDALARHPSTARHVATKLARHFIADEPPPAAVDRLARVFRDSGGDLKAMADALVDTPEAWERPLTKVKTANEFVVSTFRALSPPRRTRRLFGSLRLLGQTPFQAPSPAGWPDTAESWATAEALMQRADWAMAVSRRMAGHVAPEALLEATIGPVARRETRLAVRLAPSAAEALALVLASPEFQRR